MGTENVEGVEAAPIPVVGWMNVAILAWHGLVAESWDQQFLN
jgi:hypothetical protein